MLCVHACSCTRVEFLRPIMRHNALNMSTISQTSTRVSVFQLHSGSAAIYPAPMVAPGSSQGSTGVPHAPAPSPAGPTTAAAASSHTHPRPATETHSTPSTGGSNSTGHAGHPRLSMSEPGGASQGLTRVGRRLVGKPLAALTEKTVDGESPPLYLDWNATTPIFPEVGPYTPTHTTFYSTIAMCVCVYVLCVHTACVDRGVTCVQPSRFRVFQCWTLAWFMVTIRAHRCVVCVCMRCVCARVYGSIRPT